MLHPLRTARIAAGLSLRRLAGRANVHYTRIHYIEHGLEPRGDELLRLAVVLGCAPESLRSEHEQQPSAVAS
jgi:transcriptional regulator with XRE-family HTH domain